MAFQLPALPQTEPTWPQMQVWWQMVRDAVQTQESSQDDILTTLVDITDQLSAQLVQILAAQEAAADAQADATAAAHESARINSYPNPGNVLSASDAGTDATVTVAAHVRVYPVQGSIDIGDVALTGGEITGLAYSTRYYVYYDDPTLSMTSPTFQSTTSSATAQVGAAAGRHFVGYVTTPASGGTGTSGTGGGPPGGGGGGEGGALESDI